MKKDWRLLGLLVVLIVAGFLVATLAPRNPAPAAAPAAATSPDTDSAALDWPHRTMPELPSREAQRSTQNSGAQTSPEVHPVFQALEACLATAQGDDTAFECVRGVDTGWIPPEELGAWLCDTELRVTQCAVVLGRVFLELKPDAFLPYVDALQVRCARYRETPILLDALGRAARASPMWLEQVQDRVVPEALFAADSEALVQLAEYFVHEGNQSIRQMLEEGARGHHGGSPQQMYRAALIVIVNSPPGNPHVAFLESLVDSVMTTSEGRMGCFLAQFLISGRAAVDGSHDAAIRLLERVLQDDRFAFDAGNQIMTYFVDHPDLGSDRWRSVMDLARVAVRR